MPPASAAHGLPNPDRGLGLSLLLGTDYERKKNKLQRELQMDYKNYVAKKKDLKSNELRSQPQYVSLPIEEKLSVQEHLRDERNKEYNLYLQGQAQNRRLKRGTPHPGVFQAGVCIPSPPSPLPIINARTNINPPSCEHSSAREDAATLAGLMDNGKGTETGGPCHRGRKRWERRRPKDTYFCEEELLKDKEDELECRDRRRQERHTPGPEYKEERRTRERRAKRASQDITEVEAPSVHDQKNNGGVGRSDVQMPGSMRSATRSRSATSKENADFATGLLIGAIEEQTASQMRKEQYKQELLEQIAEKQRNTIREKKLGLRAATTGAKDSEKKPGRIKQFGAAGRGYDSYRPGVDMNAVRNDPNLIPRDEQPIQDTEEIAAPGRLHVDYSTALSQLTGKTVPAHRVPSVDYFNEDYHRDFSNVLGGVAIPRVAGVPHPVPPAITNDYKTPYDDAYYYYGARNPLYPNGLPEGVQHSGNFHSPPQRPSPIRLIGHTEAADLHRVSPRDVDNSKQKKERALSYQEALKLQIKEREERKRREKEEKERYDSKIEAEMRAYNPWGRSGGGAPIKDQKGNLVSDLNQMHRINRESYRNPLSECSGQTQSSGNGDTPEAEARTPLSHRLSGFSDEQTSKQHYKLDRYKEELKQQIEENKRKQEEERELMRIEEEKIEKKIQEQRARIQREYEEEQGRKTQARRKPENKTRIEEPISQHQEEEKRAQEEVIERKVPHSARGRGGKRTPLSYKREPSPPIPTLQKKQTNLIASRPSTVESQPSPRTERSVSAPERRPVPEKIPQPQDGQQEVMKELSALRRYLRKEQRQLEVQLGRTDRQESPFTTPNRHRGRPRVDAFEPVHRQAVQPSSHVNLQNIREFNQLKYRDTESREEVRHRYPEPPTDAPSLDIQQQALLRQQQRQIRLMKREQEHDFLDHHTSYYRSNKPARFIHRDSRLPPETALIDLYSGDSCEERDRERRPPLFSAEHRERTAPQRRHDYDRDQIQPDAQSLQSVTSLDLEYKVRAHNQQRFTRQDNRAGDHMGSSERPFGDEADVFPLRSALKRRESTETVATEPWLRPGTSDAVKRSGSRERPNSRMDAPHWMTNHIT